MKSVLLISAIAIVNIVYGKPGNNDLSKLNLKGKVKSVSFLKYDAFEKFGKMQIKYNSKTVYKFNNEGNITEISQYEANGKKIVAILNVCDSQGRVIETDTSAINNDYTKSFINYDSMGNKSELFVYNKNGDVVNKFYYIYNSGNVIEKVEIYNSDGKKESIVTYQYEFYKNKNVSAIYKHYEKNNEYSTDATDIKYCYDSIGYLIQVLYFENGSENLRNDYTYNKNGDIEAEGENITFQYTYDNKNNVTDKIKFEKKFENPTPVEYTKSEIVYYK